MSVNITGIVNFYKKKYQIINPKVSNFNQTQTTIIESKYSLTEGLKQTNYNRIINNVLSKLPDLDEWLSENALKKFNNVSWKESILKIHKSSNIESYNSDYYRRLAYDEILATFLISSQVRKKINKVKKKIKQFNLKKYNDVISKYYNKLVNSKESFSLLNSSFSKEGAYVHVPKNVVLDKPVEIVHINSGGESSLMLQPRSLVVLEKNSKAQIIESHYSLTQKQESSANNVDDFIDPLTNSLTEIHINENS